MAAENCLLPANVVSVGAPKTENKKFRHKELIVMASEKLLNYTIDFNSSYWLVQKET